MNICVIVGTRPQIIKTQPIINELLSHKAKVSIIHTGQHYDYQMSKSFFDELKIKDPDFNLGIKSGSSAEQLGKIILKLENPLQQLNPDIVIIPGDTRSALGAALCASRLNFKTAHVEAGARSNDFNLEEEINRRLIDNCTELLFAPTKNCYRNLKKEGVLGTVYFTGDTMYDVFLEFKKKLNLKKTNDEKSILLTIHRKDNIENPDQIKKIIHLANKIVSSGYKVIFPIHPHTKKQIQSFGFSLDKISTIEPVKYSKMLNLLCNSNLVITDSGGLQKEAYWLNVPCVTLRKSTEWIETLDGKHNILLSTITESSMNVIMNILRQNQIRPKSSAQFGNGKAAKKIASILLH